MANNQNNKMKGVLKGLRYISQIFGMNSIDFFLKKKKKESYRNFPWIFKIVSSYSLENIADTEKEPEMQIGLPTDVKHVAHIGFDGPAVNSPSWVMKFRILFFFNWIFWRVKENPNLIFYVDDRV